MKKKWNNKRVVKKVAKIINKFFQILIDIVIFVVLVIILFLMYRLISLRFLNKPYVNLFGYSTFEIATGSMQPALNVKDVILVKEMKEYKNGDIVSYIDGNDVITHRIVKIKKDTVITKGDDNNTDDYEVNKKNIIGKTIYVVPNGGLIREMFIRPKVIISIIVTLILINIFLSIKPKQKNVKNLIKENEVAHSCVINKHDIILIDEMINKSYDEHGVSKASIINLDR